MFDNQNNISRYNYEVQLEEIVKAICEISFDIGSQLEEVIELKSPDTGFSIGDLFTEDFLLEISVRPNSLSDYTKDEFFSFIADYYSKELMNMEHFLQILDGSDVLFIDKEKSYFIGIGEKPQARLIPALKGAKILNHLIQNLESKKIQRSLEKIGMFENDIFYKSSIKASKIDIQPILPFLPLKMIHDDLIETDLVDTDHYYVNVKEYKKLGGDFSGIDEFKICRLRKDKIELGLVVGDHVILYSNLDPTSLIKEDQLADYFWMLLDKSFTKPTPAAQASQDAVLKEFIKLRSDKDLNNLLSHLKNNFYLTETGLVTEKFESFFNTVISLNELEHLNNYQFLMSSNFEEDTALGVYTTEKVGTSYNLLHWINHNGKEKVSHYRTQVPKILEKKLILTLKPVICYYYLEKYFEEFFESILKEKGIKYIANRIFSTNQTKVEVDFLVFNGIKFIYFETKTKLSKDYIDGFLKRSSLMLNKFKPMLQKGIEIDFILLGAYSDQNVEDYRYFVDVSTEKNAEGYNQVREGLATKPYYFNVPIPDQQGRKILCIAEPHYDKLSNLVEELCQQ